MTDEEDLLRYSLELQARRAPKPGPVVARILAEAGRAPVAELSEHRRRRAVILPVLAAAAVAAVVVGIAVTDSPGHSGAPTAASRSVSAPSVTSQVGGVVNSVSSSVATSPAPANTNDLHAFRAVDLTFVGTDDGWALGTSDCIGKPGSCTAMEVTSDGGAHWHSLKNPAVNVGADCTKSCATNVRFANSSVGYVYGPSVFFMTTDGGASWQQQTGGADALETLDNNVIRIVSDSPGCPGPCNVRAELSSIAGTTWTTVAIKPGGLDVVSLAFARTGSDAYLLAMANPAGGAQNETSTLYVSHNDGQSWTAKGEPCTKTTGVEEIADSTALTTALDGTVVVACRVGIGSPGNGFVVESRNRGATFTAALPPGLASTPVQVMAAASAERIFVVTDALEISTTGGTPFHSVGTSPAPRDPSWLGFENATTAHALEGAQVWTTRDAGETWSSYTFPS